MPPIHPTAQIDPLARIDPSATIGPFCTITGPVTIGKHVTLVSHVALLGPLTIGDRTQLFPGTCIGFPPQDIKFRLGDTTAGVLIGSDCLLRENITIHAASKPDIPTTLGNKIFMMAQSHVGHDARVHDNVTLVNGAVLGGHSTVFENATLGGNAGLHQFCRVGRLAFIGGLTAVTADIPPFCVSTTRRVIDTINIVGMRRAGIDREHITGVRRAFWHVLRRNLPRKETISELEARAKDCPPILEMAEFIAAAKRPVAHCEASQQSQPTSQNMPNEMASLPEIPW